MIRYISSHTSGCLSIFLISALFLAGCSTLNFSANYYTPPSNYQAEVSQLSQKLKSQIRLKDNYSLRLIEGKDADQQKGIPFISDRTVFLPTDFVKYVYQNYYDDRFKILTSVITHEICHPEFGLPSSPPQEHFKADVMAIKLLGEDSETADYYYKSLFVVKNYWFARKGVAGHALNVGWNAMSGASLFFGGPAFFMDLYATDLDERMKLIARQYKSISRRSFQQTHEGK